MGIPESCKVMALSGALKWRLLGPLLLFPWLFPRSGVNKMLIKRNTGFIVLYLFQRFPRMISNILSEVENVQNVVELVDETVGIKYANVEKIIMVIRVFLEEQNEK